MSIHNRRVRIYSSDKLTRSSNGLGSAAGFRAIVARGQAADTGIKKPIQKSGKQKTAKQTAHKIKTKLQKI
ncbi:MAG: hypothetical protein H3C49_09490 [Alphaproteobacteria bacterium]|nr:hypothetical protein [Alphaproteobacteria bacterium]